MILYIESTKRKKPIKTNKYNKVVKYKINIQKSSVYTSKEQPENKIKKTVTFTTASKRVKYLGINLTEEVQDSYIENYKT